jgi:hypothetical protein
MTAHKRAASSCNSGARLGPWAVTFMSQHRARRASAISFNGRGRPSRDSAPHCPQGPATRERVERTPLDRVLQEEVSALE